MAVFLGSWALFLQKISRGRYWSPMWSAFSVMIAAGYLLVSGVLGYEVASSGLTDTGSPVWWEIGAGLLAAAVAFGFFRHARRHKFVTW